MLSYPQSGHLSILGSSVNEAEVLSNLNKAE